jgi:type VI secretion system protein ImpC
VSNLPTHVFTSMTATATPSARPRSASPTVARRTLGLGFLPLCHYKNTDYSVFFGAQSTQKPKKYDRPEATANAAISARLPYLMATSPLRALPQGDGARQDRLLHGGDGCRGLAEPLDQQLRQRNENAGQEMKAKYPLREAKVEVKEVPGKPGSYNAVAYLRPWLQMEELTTSMRMVARIPQKA